jgi:hypothetical protein
MRRRRRRHRCQDPLRGWDGDAGHLPRQVDSGLDRVADRLLEVLVPKQPGDEVPFLPEEPHEGLRHADSELENPGSPQVLGLPRGVSAVQCSAVQCTFSCS